MHPKMSTLDSELDAEILRVGDRLWRRIQGETPGVFNKDFWQGHLLEWVMRDHDFKVDMFRFVDVLPTLHTNEQVADHVRDYLLRPERKLPRILSTPLKATTRRLTGRLAIRSIRKKVSEMAERFIVSNDLDQAVPVLRQLHQDGFAFSADLLGESTLSDIEAERYAQRYYALIDRLAESVSAWPEDTLIDANHAGSIPRANVSLKISALAPNLAAHDVDRCVDRLLDRILPIVRRAQQRNVFVNLDLEQWHLHAITMQLFERLAMATELRHWPHIGIVIQAYLRSSSDDLDRLLNLARNRGAPITVRLVKGAYWDYELVHARQHGYPCPVFTDKAQTDHQFERLSATMLDNIDHIYPAFASHNLRSICHALAYAGRNDIPANAFEIQMLHGMAEPERRALRAMGRRVRLYAPVGELLPGIGYLVRRLLENTANTGFLRLVYHDNQDIHSLLANPLTDTTPPEHEAQLEAPTFGDLTTPFQNCPLTDFTNPQGREAFASAIRTVNAQLPLSVPMAIDNVPTTTRTTHRHPCPGRAQQIASETTFATTDDCSVAVAAAVRTWPAWREHPVHARAALLEAIAEQLYQHRFELAALQCVEVGKPWAEADADVAEAIDFCRYYARQAIIELSPRPTTTMVGEENTLLFDGRGPTVVIAPWNFPLAILCGMTVAAAVAGNTVLVKPSPHASGTAYRFYQLLHAAGMPDGIVQLLCGDEEIGAYLVAHPNIAQIAFTGSNRVGLSIIEQARITPSGQRQIKRVVAEMGGKNAIIVDDDADLDDAVAGVMYSAFGYAGQKCSACSRAIVLDSVYDAFVERLVEACRSLPIAEPHLPTCRLGPVIDESAYRRLHDIAENPGDGVHRLYCGTIPDELDGWYIPPTVLAISEPQHPLMQTELFGPVLAVTRAATFDDAIAIANNSAFALTAGIFSRSPTRIDIARRCLRVGNLYINRSCTGAMVERQPFGGFAMSGMGTKAGGNGYLMNFVDQRCITENSMRHGFTPDVAM